MKIFSRLGIKFFEFFTFTGASTVKIRRLDVPDAVRAGTEVRLTCDYDLEVYIIWVLTKEQNSK